MDDYIRRSDVLSLKHRLHNHSKDTIELHPVYVISPDAVDNIPSADVAEVKHGKWIRPTRVPDSMLDECSICGFDTGAFTFNYCPNCGADMRGGT